MISTAQPKPADKPKLTFQQLSADLAQHTGSETFKRHWSKRLIYTEGIETLAETAGDYWLIDAIASHQPAVTKAARKDPRLADFQIWPLFFSETHDAKGRNAVLSCCADISRSGKPDNRCVVQELWTDFPPTIIDGNPFQRLKLYLERGEHWCLMLPSE